MAATLALRVKAPFRIERVSHEDGGFRFRNGIATQMFDIIPVQKRVIGRAFIFCQSDGNNGGVTTWN